MKKYHLISLIALTSIALAGCEWDSSKYDNFVTDGNVTTCPGEPKQAGNKYFPNVCNLIKIGNLYCGPESSNGVNLIAVNDDGSIFCVNNETQGFKPCPVNLEDNEKYSMEWKICQGYRKNGLFDNITTDCKDKNASKALTDIISKGIFIGSVGSNNNPDKKYVEAREHGVCPSDYPVCYYDSNNKQIGCIAMIECGGDKCDPRSETCEPDANGKLSCVNKCACDDGYACDPNGNCVKILKTCTPSCDNETQICDQTEGVCKDISVIISDPCFGRNCDYNTQYCKLNAGIYECADIALNPCESYNCTDAYCAQPDGPGGNWQCVPNESCTNSCSSAAYSCLPAELAQKDPGNCGGCSAENENYNCYKKFKNANVSCENGQCKSSACYDGFYRKDENGSCFPYGFEDAYCTESLDCTILLEGWASGKCEKAVDESGNYNYKNNKCIATTCQAGYHLYDDGNGMSCEKDSSEHCGSHENACGEIANSSSVVCDNGGCKITCNLGAHLYEDSSSNTICELDDDNNCGAHERACNTDSITHSTSVLCSTGVCLPETCESGYHPYSNTCEADDNDNCGAHEKTCVKDNVTGSETVSCSMVFVSL